ncbi:hypothetical protein QYE76_067336 [Lolium multiflorum]|uniref:Uncharacterized protein n=1 Tax=Lolium multiflorum TaxID=4521 RepID=A0AAD8WAN2_LOLMU|nr:hypothetical protein QYE76_067336 [Lolium multiflorum]
MASATSSLLVLWLCAVATTAWAHGGTKDGDADADGAEKKPDLRAPGLVVAKLWCLTVVFVGTMAGGVSPYFMRWNEAFLVLGTQFAGGVFLGTAMMHFLSDANETFQDLVPDSAFPFAFMLACAGYVLTMLAECAISFVVARGRTKPAATVAGALEEGKLSSPNGNGSEPQAADAHGDHSAASMLRNASTLGDSILLIAALCFHSVFEGIAIGVAETKADAWKALWTVSLHKIFAAIAMGIALLRMLPNRPLFSCIAYAFAFAISSPIGVGIGIVIDATTQGKVADWVFAISMGLATGIFIYVSVNHLLSKGYKPQRPVTADTPLGRWLAVVLGVGVIAVVMIWDT